MHVAIIFFYLIFQNLWIRGNTKIMWILVLLVILVIQCKNKKKTKKTFTFKNSEDQMALSQSETRSSNWIREPCSREKKQGKDTALFKGSVMIMKTNSTLVAWDATEEEDFICESSWPDFFTTSVNLGLLVSETGRE